MWSWRRSGAWRLSQTFGLIKAQVLAQPQVLVHRDYHSRNLMLHRGQLYIIDFQDARMGPNTYDLVSLLRDAYIAWEEGRQIDWVGCSALLRMR